MAIKRKQVKKNSDTLIDLTQAKSQATGFFEENQKLILGGLAALIIIVGGWFIYTNLIKAPKEEKAMSQMWMAQIQFEQDSFQVALDNPGGGYPGFVDIIKDY